ncbi:MAG: amylo-alpha-1,6-glucosidase, partial [Tannerella sp.]|nr:amylo-alpha-1,6-glucosidase [Tannerella sp.]
PYLAAGDKAYIIGTQDGLFPDLGSHLRGEMGGIWTLPIKLADGFWLKLNNTETQEEYWLMKADTFINYPFGNQFVYNSVLDGIKVSRTQYAPEGKTGVVIQYTFENISKTARNLGLDFVVKTEICPVWFSKQNGIIDDADTIRWNEQSGLFYANDVSNDWYAVWGTNAAIEGYNINSSCPVETKGKGKSATLNSSLKLKPGKKKVVTYFICGSTESVEEAKTVYADLSQNKDALLAQKKDLYYSVLERSRIEIPDKKLQETYNWVKINTQWLVSDLKGLGRFLGAGAVEYPWLFGCDNSYAQQGVLATSDFELAKSTLLSLKNVSERVNGNGQIIHEMSSNGFVYNKGNTQETAHYIMAVWKAFLWTGDIDFLREVYPYIKKGIQWLTVDMDTNHNLFPEGYGIVEIDGLEMELIDVAVYTEQALEVTAQMALLFDDATLAADLQSKANALKEKINTQFWNEEESSYCDFYGTREQAISSTKREIELLKYVFRDDPESLKEKTAYYNTLLEKFLRLPQDTEQGWLTYKNWIITMPMETGIAPRERAIRSLDIIRMEHCGEYGPHHTAAEENHMMTMITGGQAMSEARYGRTDEMLWYVNCIANTLHRTLPGSINEMMPDGGCPVQAWTIYGIATPIITHIFGVSPDAYHKQVVFEPHLPTGWDKITLSNLRIGDNIFSIKITRETGKTVYDISSKNDLWKYTLLPIEKSAHEYVLNGKKITPQPDGIFLSGKKNQIIVQ